MPVAKPLRAHIALWLSCGLIWLTVLVAAPQPPAAIAHTTADRYTVWTKFDNSVNAIIADGDDFWIAGSQPVVRWDVAAATGDVIGVPQHDVLCAVGRVRGGGGGDGQH